MRIIAFLFFLLVASSPALAVPCVTGKEARADALIAFFTVRHLSADLCQDRLGIKGMVALRKRVKARFKGRIEAAGKIREKYFQRIYGEKWRESLYRVNQKYALLILRTVRPNQRLCSELRADLRRQLAEGWAYVGPKVEQAFLKTRNDPQVLICKGV